MQRRWAHASHTTAACDALHCRCLQPGSCVSCNPRHVPWSISAELAHALQVASSMRNTALVAADGTAYQWSHGGGGGDRAGSVDVISGLTGYSVAQVRQAPATAQRRSVRVCVRACARTPELQPCCSGPGCMHSYAPCRCAYTHLLRSAAQRPAYTTACCLSARCAPAVTVSQTSNAIAAGMHARRACKACED